MLHQKPPTDAELEAAGFTRADYEDDEDNLEEVIFSEEMAQSWELFSAMSTQWRYAPSGVITGLDYNVFPMLAKLYKIEDEEIAFEDIRVLERATLEIAQQSK